jgi:pimeloyl-ACP methyl ester carboxylesterase
MTARHQQFCFTELNSIIIITMFLLLPIFLILIVAFTLVQSFDTPKAERRVICGRPCLVVQAASEVLYPTLVVLGGIAQSATSWEHQLPSLSRNRQVVVYECLGQGKRDKNARADAFANVSLPVQAELLLTVLNELVEHPDDMVDIAGFSFGGRVAMTAACSHSDRIRKLHLTGVGCDRSDYGHLAMDSFKDAIQSDPSLRSFAWAILLATYSPKYLRQLSNEIRERFLNHITTNNSADGMLAILQQAEVRDERDLCHVKSMGERLGKIDIAIKLCVGELDLMAPVGQVKLLGELLEAQEVDIVPGCGHAVGVEGARAWKDSVLNFMNDL